MQNKKITILGATGFIGAELVAKLSVRGYDIIALTHRNRDHRKLIDLSNVTIVEANVHDQTSLELHFKDSAAVINLVGILNESGNTTHTFESAHVTLAQKTVNACKATGVTRLLHMSALSADADNGSSEYLKSKGRGEASVFAAAGAEVAVTAFRPSVIFGAGDSFFNRFAGLLKLLPIFPLACGTSKLAPVFVGDVCDRMIDSLEDPNAAGKCFNLVGPKEYSLEELVKYTAHTAGLNRKVINLPDWAARLQAKAMGVLPGKPFSMDNYNSLQTDSICHEESAKQLTSIEDIVPGYIGKQRCN